MTILSDLPLNNSDSKQNPSRKPQSSSKKGKNEISQESLYEENPSQDKENRKRSPSVVLDNSLIATKKQKESHASEDDDIDGDDDDDKMITDAVNKFQNDVVLGNDINYDSNFDSNSDSDSDSDSDSNSNSNSSSDSEEENYSLTSEDKKAYQLFIDSIHIQDQDVNSYEVSSFLQNTMKSVMNSKMKENNNAAVLLRIVAKYSLVCDQLFTSIESSNKMVNESKKSYDRVSKIALGAMVIHFFYMEASLANKLNHCKGYDDDSFKNILKNMFSIYVRTLQKTVIKIILNNHEIK